MIINLNVKLDIDTERVEDQDITTGDLRGRVTALVVSDLQSLCNLVLANVTLVGVR